MLEIEKYQLLAAFLCFLLLFIAVPPLLMKPLLAVFLERSEHHEGHEGSPLDALRRDTATAQEAVDSQILAAKRAGQEERATSRRALEEEQQRILASAQGDALRTIASGRAALAAQRAEIDRAVAGDGEVMAKSLATKILGREVQA